MRIYLEDLLYQPIEDMGARDIANEMKEINHRKEHLPMQRGLTYVQYSRDSVRYSLLEKQLEYLDSIIKNTRHSAKT